MTLDNIKLNNIICKWVEKNYGESEAQDPSWSIVELANHIAEQYNKPLEEEANPFELTMLVKQDMTLKELDALHDVVMQYFDDKDVQKRWENHGIKRLAYDIKGETQAGYFCVEGSLADTNKHKLVEVLDTNPYMLRYLLMRQNKPERDLI